ncbi:MAG: FtsX-like permease family protein [Roseivirga sp.]|nr:FtsX-like permease family protein [Roseivirga sp.]
MSKEPKHIAPPTSADRFLSLFCRSELLEEVKGDLHECFGIEQEEKGTFRARWLYWYHVLHFLRPFAIKNKRQNSNIIIMYKSYFKFAWRNILKHKGSALMNVLSLSVGIACFVFIFIYLKGELGYDKFHQDADRIHRVVIDLVESDGKILPDATTPPALAPALKTNFAEVEASVRIFPGWGTKFLMGVNEDQKFYEEGLIRTDSTFFDVFSFPFIHGNAETALNNPRQLVITRSAALKYFNRVDVVGEVLTVFSMRNAKVKITGVIEDVPENSHFKFDFLTRLTFRDLDDNWGWWNYYTYVKLANGADVNGLQAKLPAFYERSRPDQDNYAPIYTQAITDIHLKSNLKWELGTNGNMSNIYIFGALALFVLLISCINYLNLTVAGSLKRMKEVGVRKVFGAHRQSLISQFLIEALLMVIFSVLLGGLLAEFIFQNTADVLGKEMSIVDSENLLVFGLIAIAVLVVGLLTGLYPALHLSSFKVSNAVKGIVSKSGKPALALRKSLLVIQFAISGVMIIGTIVVFQQLRHLQNTELGFDAEQVLMIENANALSSQETLKTELNKMPGVSEVGATTGVVGGQNWTTTIGYPDEVLLNYVVADPEFMSVMDFEFVAGRNFSREFATDVQGNNIIVNEQGLKELGLSLDDVGKPIPITKQNDTIRNGSILGVVKDFHFTNFKSEIKPFGFYFRDRPQSHLGIKLSTANLSETMSQIESAWNDLANGAPFEYYFLDESYGAMNAQENKLLNIMSYLTFLAIFIAFIGMFAIANLTIKDKRKEIAIRKVLGASTSGVSNMITSKFLTLVLIANLIAGPLAYLVMQQWLDGFAYRTSLGVTVFAIAIVSTLLVAWFTVGFQSFKAAISNPVKSLRQD